MPENTLSPRQARFVSALLVTGTIAEAARRAGIGERTAYRFLSDCAVQEALGRCLDGALADATRQVTASVGEALDALSAIVRDPAVPAPSRVAAARSIIDAGPRYRQALDFATRLARVEEQQRSKEDAADFAIG